MLPDNVRIVLQLDGLTERERHRRRTQAQLDALSRALGRVFIKLRLVTAT